MTTYTICNKTDKTTYEFTVENPEELIARLEDAMYIFCEMYPCSKPSVMLESSAVKSMWTYHGLEFGDMRFIRKTRRFILEMAED